MILGPVEHLGRYAAAHPRFAAAIAFVRGTTLTALPPGRHAIDGDEIYVSIDHVDGRTRQGARLEAHRKYIDIQITISGEEEIGWRPLHACAQPEAEYSEGRDIVFFGDEPSQWVKVPPGYFVIFFPEDAHAPLGGNGALHKAVLKIRA